MGVYSTFNVRLERTRTNLTGQKKHQCEDRRMFDPVPSKSSPLFGYGHTGDTPVIRLDAMERTRSKLRHPPPCLQSTCLPARHPSKTPRQSGTFVTGSAAGPRWTAAKHASARPCQTRRSAEPSRAWRGTRPSTEDSPQRSTTWDIMTRCSQAPPATSKDQLRSTTKAGYRQERY